ncbi:hypothetical protein [Pseudonocardia sp. ICBG1142]|uniref:hypothetical protein n=1 Tax=Pseudonocardia sp. ICBG1142 TaxID=2846760 RepID=UPI001CF627B0|nr:hypothetical protein [Pseudonocardia sp. ICBG1142]
MRFLKIFIAVLFISAVVVGSAFLNPSEAYAATKTIGDCDIIMEVPHASGHVRGNVTVDPRIKCKTKQRYLGVTAVMERKFPGSQYTWKISAKRKGDNVNYMNATPNERCQKADYRVKADFLIVDNRGVRHEEFGYVSIWKSNPCRLL